MLLPGLAKQLLLPQGAGQRRIVPTVVVVHTNGGPGTVQGLYDYWRPGPGWPLGSGIFSHFQIDFDGTVGQYQDTELEAPAEWAANSRAVSIETQDDGNPDAPWTRAQALALATLIAALCDAHAIPTVLVSSPDGNGIGYHEQFPEWNRNSHRCLPVDITEVLTRRGWVPVGQATMDDEVASWNADSGLIRFERPLGLIPVHVQSTVTVRGFEMTADHDVYAAYSNVRKPHLHVFKPIPAGEMPNSTYDIPAAGLLADAPGLPLSDDMLRLLVWAQADGHMAPHRDGRAHLDFHFTRARKIEQVTALLERLGVEHRRSDCANGSTRIKVYDPDTLAVINRWLPDKSFSWEWLDLTPEQVAVVFDECQDADGSRSHRVLVSDARRPINADVMQALAVTHGWVSVSNTGRTSLHTPGKSHITYSGARDRGAGRGETAVACLTTVDGTLVVRQRGRVVILGNCPGFQREQQLRNFVIPHALPSPPSTGPDAPYDGDLMNVITLDGKTPRIVNDEGKVSAVLGSGGWHAVNQLKAQGMAKIADVDAAAYAALVANGQFT